MGFIILFKLSFKDNWSVLPEHVGTCGMPKDSAFWMANYIQNAEGYWVAIKNLDTGEVINLYPPGIPLY